ncbi:hypothetical protein ACFL1B_04280 [Nanoarchaeota archaeon]
MEGDLSKKTITVLVVLTVIISLLGTLSVMSAVSDMKTSNTPAPVTTVKTQGEVALEIIGPKEFAEPSTATGEVTLEILEPEKPRILLLPE